MVGVFLVWEELEQGCRLIGGGERARWEAGETRVCTKHLGPSGAEAIVVTVKGAEKR